MDKNWEPGDLAWARGSALAHNSEELTYLQSLKTQKQADRTRAQAAGPLTSLGFQTWPQGTDTQKCTDTFKASLQLNCFASLEEMTEKNTTLEKQG